jgi:predicted O-methyltransferase YrrM
MDSRYIRKAFSKIPGLRELSRRAQRRKRARSYYLPTTRRINNWARKKTESSNFYYELTEDNKADLAALISVVTKTSIVVIENLFKELDNDTLLRTHIEDSWAHNSQMADAKVAYARRIGWYVLTRILKPKIVIETGVHQGVGACVITSALIKNSYEGHPGRYLGIDIDRNAGQLLTYPYSEFGTLIYGNSLDCLNALNESVDLFINDSDHNSEYEKQEYATVINKLSDTCVILGDNCHASGALRDFSRKNDRNFLFFKEIPADHWYPGAGIGFSYKSLETGS